MKLNKKIITGALALAMGLGAVAPAATRSYADEAKTTTTATETDKYKEAGEAWLKAYKAAKELKDTKSTLESKKTKALAEIDSLNDKIAEKDEEPAKLAEKAEDDKLALDNKAKKDKEAAEKKYEGMEDRKQKIAEEKAAIEKKLIEDKAAIDIKLGEDKEISKAELTLLQKDLRDEKNNLEKIKSDLNKDYIYGKDDKDNNLKAKIDVAIKKLEEIEKEKKTAFEKVGGTEEIMEEIIKEDEVVLPEEDETTKKIRETKARMEEKLSALKAVKEYMPQSYKRYKKVIDEAVKSAEKSLKLANDYLAGLEK